MRVLKAVFCDVDGTLTGHAEKPTDADIRASIRRLRQRGVLFGIATSHAFDEPLTRRFVKYYAFDCMALENGSDLYVRQDGGRYTQLASFQAGTARRRRQLGLLAGLLRGWARQGDGPPLQFGAAPDRAEELTVGTCRLTAQYRQASILLRTREAHGDLRPLIRKLRAAAGQNGWRLKFIEPRRDFVEIAVANKAEGVRALCRHYGVTPRHIAAIGDGENDLEMLAMAGLPACPSDVPPALKRIVRQQRGLIGPGAEYVGVRHILRILADRPGGA